jgi:hypothetical protein
MVKGEREGNFVKVDKDLTKNLKSVVTDEQNCHDRESKRKDRCEAGESPDYYYDFLKRCLIILSNVVSCRLIRSSGHIPLFRPNYEGTTQS